MVYVTVEQINADLEKIKTIADKLGMNYEIVQVSRNNSLEIKFWSSWYLGQFENNDIQLAYKYLSSQWSDFGIKDYKDMKGRLKALLHSKASFFVDIVE